MEGNPTYDQAIYSIKLLREQFQSDYLIKSLECEI